MMTLLEKALFLHGTDLFAAMPTPELASMAEMIRQVGFAAGEPLLEPGRESELVYLVAAGEVELLRGGEPLVRLEAGEVVALWTLFAAKASPIRAVATRETVVLALERRELMRLMDIHQEVARGALRSMVRHYRRLREAGTESSGTG